jgi:hypothetical protein
MWWLKLGRKGHRLGRATVASGGSRDGLRFRREGRNTGQGVTRRGVAGPLGGAHACGGQKGEQGYGLLGGRHGGAVERRERQ